MVQGSDGGIPFILGLVECAVLKHAVHARRSRNVPAGNVPVKSTLSKHPLEVLDLRDVPLGNISVEGRLREQVVQACHARDVDVVEVGMHALLRHGVGNSFFQHIAAGRDNGDVSWRHA